MSKLFEHLKETLKEEAGRIRQETAYEEVEEGCHCSKCGEPVLYENSMCGQCSQ